MQKSSFGQWTTALLKEEKSGEVWAGTQKLIGDEQADLKHHGGDFGENLTVDGLDETCVAIGDVFEIGEALVQVTQPRSPCWKIARFHGIKELALYVQETDFIGWYLRVLREGLMKAGCPIIVRQAAIPRVTVQEANAIAYSDQDPVPLLECAALSKGWREKFEEKQRTGRGRDFSRRLYGK